MHISAWAIRHPIPVTLLFVLLLLSGVAGFSRLPVKLIPDVSFPTVEVRVSLPGASAGTVETQVTRGIEAAVASVAGVDHVQSTVTLGRTTTTVTFDIGEDPQRANDEVKAAVDGIREQLPRDAEIPVVSRVEFDAKPVATYAVVAPALDDIALSHFVDDIVARRLTAAKGVAQVQRLGGATREINVTLNSERLEALGLSAGMVNDAVRRAQLDAPGGRADIGGAAQTIRVTGAVHTADALTAMTVPLGDGRMVRIGDVATVSDGAAERDRIALYDGRPVVAFQVMKARSASDVAVEDGVARTVAQLARDNRGVRFRKLISGAQDTRDSYAATMATLVEGMALAAIVVFAFLREWRSTVIAALAMPIALVPTFAAMALLGFSLNIITLLGLTLVIGVLVDDAIVEIENIEKRIEKGEAPFRAALHGADEIGLAVIATTMSIVVVFVPVSFMPGMAGRFFREFGLTVSIAVLFSLLVARLLTPLLAAYFLRPAKRTTPQKPFAGPYRRAVEWTLANRWLSLAGAAALFAGSSMIAATLPTGFTPESDDGLVTIRMEGAPGAELRTMRTAGARLTEHLRRVGDVATVFVSVGATGDVRSGTIVIVLRKDRNRTTQAFQAAIRPLLMRQPDVRLSIGEAGGGSGGTVQVTLSGEDGQALSRAALAVERDMRKLDVLANVHQTTPRASAELVVRPKTAEAARLGVSTEAIASVVRIATLGEVDANLPRLDADNQRLAVRIRMTQTDRTDLDALSRLQVPLLTGSSVPLGAVADFSFEAGASRIERFDRERRATVEAELTGVSIGQALKRIDALPSLRTLPAGVSRPKFGQAEDMAELFGGFVIAMGAGIALLFAVLVLLFHSFFKPVTILAALPLSLAGAFIGLKLGGAAVNLPALIGLLMLMGLAAKNSILLVEHAIEAERAGVGRHDALIDACHERARPIIMTTCAMAAGMVPTVLGLGEGAEFRVPMALAVIGGLISSTALSLVLVPVVYEFVGEFEQWITPKLHRLVGQSDN